MGFCSLHSLVCQPEMEEVTSHLLVLENEVEHPGGEIEEESDEHFELDHIDSLTDPDNGADGPGLF